MSTNKVLLDVDRSIIENNLLIKDSGLGFATPNDELERLFPLPRTPDQPSQVIQLTPGLCVKTRTTAGLKVFLNICTAPEIPAPPIVEEAELARILSSENELATFRVPMSLGEGRTDTDKSGTSCQVFDVAVHPTAMQRLSESELFRQFILTAAMEGIQSKYNVELNVADVVLLAKRKSMGTPKSQRVRTSGPPQPLGPLISEICPAKAVDLKPRIRVPKYKIRGEPLKGTLERMIAELSLPDVGSSSELEVDVGEDRMVVQGLKSGYKLDVFLPHLVRQDAVRADFSTTNRVLTLLLPLQSYKGQ